MSVRTIPRRALLAATICGLGSHPRRVWIEIRPELVSRDAGNCLDLQHALGRSSAADDPVRHGPLRTHPEQPGERHLATGRLTRFEQGLLFHARI